MVVAVFWCPGVVHNSVLQPNDPPNDKTADRFPAVVEGIRVASVLCVVWSVSGLTILVRINWRDVTPHNTRAHYTHTYTLTHTLIRNHWLGLKLGLGLALGLEPG